MLCTCFPFWKLLIGVYLCHFVISLTWNVMWNCELHVLNFIMIFIKFHSISGFIVKFALKFAFLDAICIESYAEMWDVNSSKFSRNFPKCLRPHPVTWCRRRQCCTMLFTITGTNNQLEKRREDPICIKEKEIA